MGRPNSYYILSLKHASKYVVNKIHTTCMLYYKLLLYYKHVITKLSKVLYLVGFYKSKHVNLQLLIKVAIRKKKFSRSQAISIDRFDNNSILCH